MTLCLGFTDQDAVYLIADAAVTFNRNSEVGYSTFGEVQHTEPGMSVQERALKLMRWGNIAATFTDDAMVAREIFANFITALRARSIRDAFASAWISSLPAVGPAKVTALLGFVDEEGPHLLKFGEGFPIDGTQVSSACIGNVSVDIARSVEEEAIGQLSAFAPPGSDRLAFAVAWLQHHTIFQNLMEYGIGGHFAGCWIGENGFAWAGDTFHVLTRGELTEKLNDDMLSYVLVCSRLDAFFVMNNKRPGFSVFGNSFGENVDLTHQEIVDKIFAKRLEVLPELSAPDFSVDYVVFHNLLTQRSTVFSTRDKNQSSIAYQFDRDANRMMFQVAPQTMAIILGGRGDVLFIHPTDAPISTQAR